MGMKKKGYTDWQWYLVGTTQVLLSTDAFEIYQNATGAVYDPDTGLLKIKADQYENLESIYIKVNCVCVL